MHHSPDAAFDFEDWALLANTDPRAFEAKREEAIATLIAKAPPNTQKRLRALQWKIDAERSLAVNPLSSCIRIFDQMWTSVYGEGGLLESLRSLEGAPLPDRTSAVVLELHRHRPAQRQNNLTFPTPP